MTDASISSEYKQKIVNTFSSNPAFSNVQMIPTLEKIVVNQSTGDFAENAKYLEAAIKDLENITGQKPVVTRAKKPIAAFKIREDMPVGICVTLRGEKMYAFLDRLIHLSFPRIRDFQGLSKKHFDGCGNYTLGLTEQLLFPEIQFDKIQKLQGLEISLVTSAKNDEDGFVLLKGVGFPFVA